MGARISAVINTFKEEKNISYALRSVRSWVDEIVVVDMYSDDRTVDIAREFGAKVYFHERATFVEPARAFAMSQANGDWLLILDADEIVPEPLSRKLVGVANEGGVDAVRLPRLNYLFGSPMQHTGWGRSQDKHVRFFRRGCVGSTSTIHDPLKPIPGARILELPSVSDYAIVHFNYLDVSQFLEKLNRYTTIEAQEAKATDHGSSLFRASVRAVREFLRRYVKARGYRDGWRGFYLSLFMAFYRLATCAKRTELDAVGTREAVQGAYRAEAEKILNGYR